MGAEDQSVTAVVQISKEILVSSGDIIRYLLQLLLNRRAAKDGLLVSAAKGLGKGVCALGRGVHGLWEDKHVMNADGKGLVGDVDWQKANRAWGDRMIVGLKKDAFSDPEHIEKLREELKHRGVDFAISDSPTGEMQLMYRIPNEDLVAPLISDLPILWGEKNDVPTEDQDARNEAMETAGINIPGAKPGHESVPQAVAEVEAEPASASQVANIQGMAARGDVSQEVLDRAEGGKMTVGEAQRLIRANDNPRPESVAPDMHPSPEEMARAVKSDLEQEHVGVTPAGSAQTQTDATVIPFVPQQGSPRATQQAPHLQAASAAQTAPKPAPRHR
ncbi:hypothetical protein [Tractidigestivibacter sp.]|uniref:hypothetical protein n=1 Tax=Tractidigestivibacter sp. TaxID=2847320 RepID=UPI003AEFFEFC